MQDAVIEVGSIGLLALCIRAAHLSLQAPQAQRSHWLKWGLLLSLLAACSPYYMVYLAR